MSENKRQLKNFIINKQFQTRFIIYFVSLSIALLGLMIFFMHNEMTSIRILVANINEVDIHTMLGIDEALFGLLRISFIFFFFALMGTMIFALIISHRFAGPMFVIAKFIDQLKAGDYESRRNLRPHDELIPIMESLQELADVLKNKSRK